MKLKNKIMAMAVVAVAGVNAYIADDVIAKNSEVSLLNLENMAEATERAGEVWHYGPDGNYSYICDGKTEEICADSENESWVFTGNVTKLKRW